MATIDLTFAKENTSIVKGDTVYFNNPTTANGFTTSGNNTKIGEVASITINDSNQQVISVTTTLSGIGSLSTNSFIFFSKDNKYNMSSLKGYFASMKLKNDTTDAAELFSVSCEIAPSSK